MYILLVNLPMICGESLNRFVAAHRKGKKPKSLPRCSLHWSPIAAMRTFNTVREYCFEFVLVVKRMM